MAEEVKKIYYDQYVTEYKWNHSNKTETPVFISIQPKKHLKETKLGYTNTADKRFFRDRKNNILFHADISKIIKQTLHQIRVGH